MGGSIRAQSEGPGKGVTFEIELPLESPDDDEPGGSASTQEDDGLVEVVEWLLNP